MREPACETRYPGRDGIFPDSLETISGVVILGINNPPIEDPPLPADTLYSPHFGSVTYSYAGDVDQPWRIRRADVAIRQFQLGVVDMFPQYDWRGVMDGGRTVSGGTIQGLGIPVDFPSAYTQTYRRTTAPGVPESWFGGLVDEMRDGSGLQYRRARCYDPLIGRFTQEDPIGLAGGLKGIFARASLAPRP